MTNPLPENKEILIPEELVMNQIYQIRGQKVMLDSKTLWSGNKTVK